MGLSPRSERGRCRLSVLCLFLTWLLWSVLVLGLGVMLTTLEQQFASHSWLVGWIVAIINAVISAVGPLTGPLQAIMGGRRVVAVCGFLIGSAIMAASLVTSLGQLTIILAAVAGPSVSFACIMSRANVGLYCTSNYGTACALGGMGFPFGMISLPPFIRLLLDSYGWRGTLLVLGAVSLHLGPVGCLLPRVDPSQCSAYSRLLDKRECEDGVEEPTSPCPGGARLRRAAASLHEHLGLSVCGRPAFWISLALYLTVRFATDLWSIYFVAYVLAKGLGMETAVLLTSIAGLSTTAVKVLSCVLVDRGCVRLRPAQVLLTVIGAVAFALSPWLQSYWTLMAGTIVSTGCMGSTFALIDIFIRDVLGVDLLVGAYSWMELGTGIIIFALGFYPGWIYEQTGSYDLAFVILALGWSMSLGALLIEWLLGR